MKFNKFNLTDDCDFDCRVRERIMVGRLTPMRYKVITRAVRLYNHEAENPYGVSRNGYAYRCGCEHDCCGCLIGQSINLNFIKAGGNYIVKLTHSQTFNY